MDELDLDMSMAQEPYKYIEKCKNLKMNTVFLKAFNHWIGLSNDKLKVIDEISKMLIHSMTLMDDIETNATVRYGFPAAHTIFGTPLTINAAFCQFYIALDKLLDAFPDKAVESSEIYIEQMLTVQQGRGIDIFWHDTNKCPTEEEYIELIKQKTGDALKIGPMLMQQLANNSSQDFGHLISLISVYFQIKTDYVKIKAICYPPEEYNLDEMKDDLQKFSFPVIHAFHSSPENATILNFIKPKTINSQLRKLIAVRLESTQSLVYTEGKLQNLAKEILAEIENLGGNLYLEQLIEASLERNDMADF